MSTSEHEEAYPLLPEDPGADDDLLLGDDDELVVDVEPEEDDHTYGE